MSQFELDVIRFQRCGVSFGWWTLGSTDAISGNHFPVCGFCLGLNSRTAGSGSGMGRIIKMRLVAAPPPQIEVQWCVLDTERIGDELVPGLVVPGDPAGHAERGRNRPRRANLHPCGCPHRPSPRPVIELDRGATYDIRRADSRAEILERRAAGAAQKDVGERRELIVGAPRVDIQDDAPRLVRLVIAV